MVGSPKSEDFDLLVMRVCDGTITEAEAQTLIDAALHENEVRVTLVRQVLMDRLLRVAAAPPLDAAVVMRALPTNDKSLGIQTLADTRLQSAKAPWLRDASEPKRVKSISGRWGKRLAPLFAVAVTAAAVVLAFELFRARDGLQPLPHREVLADASPTVLAQTSAQNTLTTSAAASTDDASAQPPGLARSHVVLNETLANGSAEQSGWEVGTAAPCPPGIAVSLCLKSARMGNQKYRQQFGVTWGNWHDVLFTQEDPFFISFDYWVGDTTVSRPQITLAVHGDDGRTYRLDFATQGRAKWTHVVAPLRRARYWHDAARTLAPGEGVRALHFTINWGDDDVFFLANVQVAAYTPP